MWQYVVHNQLTDFLCGNNILDIFQSGFRTKHSTESSLLNDILLSIDSGKCVALMMLDLTAAFDTLDHAILIERLRDYVGIRGVALKWFSSYLQDRTCLKLEITSRHLRLSLGGFLRDQFLVRLYSHCWPICYPWAVADAERDRWVGLD